MTTCAQEKPDKRVVMAQKANGVVIDEEWGAGQELPVIPDMLEVINMAMTSDISGLLALRDTAVFYQALANGQRKQLDKLYEKGGVVMSVLLGGSNE